MEQCRGKNTHQEKALGGGSSIQAREEKVRKTAAKRRGIVAGLFVPKKFKNCSKKAVFKNKTAGKA